MKVIVAVRKIKSRILPGNINLETITPSMIYSCPTIRKLVAYLYESGRMRCNGTPPLERPQTVDMRMMIDRYLPKIRKRPLVVILTGSTGSLGSYLLNSLMSKDEIGTIYCVNRTADGAKRQTESSDGRELSRDWSGKDVRFYQADLSEKYLGLEKSRYEEMVRDVNMILRSSDPRSILETLTAQC